MTPEDWFNLLLETMDDDIINELISMKYWDYLKSEYWEIVRDYLFYIKGDICTFCDELATQVHHTTYKYRNEGTDHEHLEVLYPICKYCHRKIHNKSKIDTSNGNIIYLGNININDFWTLFISEEKEPHVRLKYIETEQKNYLKERRFLDFIISNKHLVGSHIYRQFHPK